MRRVGKKEEKKKHKRREANIEDVLGVLKRSPPG